MQNSRSTPVRKRKRVGITADHTGIELMQYLARTLREAGYHVTDFGKHLPQGNNHRPDFIAPLATAISNQSMDQGIAICRGGDGVAAAANMFKGVCACLVDETFFSPLVMEEEGPNLICLDGRVVSHAVTWELVHNFLTRHVGGADLPRRGGPGVVTIEGSLQEMTRYV